jgi:hypothetical protein
MKARTANFPAWCSLLMGVRSRKRWLFCVECAPALFLEPVLSLSFHLVEILPRVEDNSFPLDAPDAPVPAGAAGVRRHRCRDAPLRSIRIGASLTRSGQSAEDLVTILEHYGQITRNGPVAIEVIRGSLDPGFGALQAFAVRPIVREAAMNLENADLMTGHVSAGSDSDFMAVSKSSAAHTLRLSWPSPCG